MSLESVATDDHERFVVEPEATVAVQDRLRGIEIRAGCDHGIEPLFLNLIHVNRRVPRRKHVSTDAVADLGWRVCI